MDQLEELLCPQCCSKKLIATGPDDATCFRCGYECKARDLVTAAARKRELEIKQLKKPSYPTKKRKLELLETTTSQPSLLECGTNFDMLNDLAAFRLSAFSLPSGSDSDAPAPGPTIDTTKNSGRSCKSNARTEWGVSGANPHLSVLGGDGSLLACTHPPHSALSSGGTVRCGICGQNKECDHATRVVINSDYAGVCTVCGTVVAEGMALFELGCLPGAPFHNRRGSYKIIYYWNEKLAQWSRRCPRPPEPVLRAFLEEAKNVSATTRPADFTRKTIARICRTIGSPTTQEKWLMLFDILADTPGFETVPKFSFPSNYLLSKIQDCFRIVLPVWFQCKDVDITEDVKLYLRENPEHAKNTEITKLLKPKYGMSAKRRKSFPHNFMIHKFLQQLQQIFHDDEQLHNCYDTHEKCHKHISSSIHFYQSMIWKHICESINSSAGAGGIDLTLSLSFSACSNRST